MAALVNPRRGEVALGDHVLRFTVNSICALEADLGVGLPEIGARLADGVEVTMLRAMLRCALLHRDGTITAEDAGDIMDDHGVAATADAVGKALQAAFPSAKGGDVEDPTQPATLPTRSAV